MELLTNGFRLTVTYPASFSGQVWSVYQQNTPALEANLTNSFNGLESTWTLTFDNLVLTGETATSWTDLQPMGSDTNGNPVHRFYGVGSNEDSDNDELQSGYELFVSHTDEEDEDSDGDGLSDGWEVANGFNPNDGAGANGSGEDADFDGLSNAEEQELGTDPWVANPVHEVGPEEAVFEYRSIEVTRSKPGFVNFVTDTNGVDRCYLEYESYGEVFPPYSMGDHTTWSCHRTVDPVSGKTPMPGDEGVYENERAGGDWWSSTLNMDYQATGTWWLASLYEDSQGSIPQSFSWTGTCNGDDPLDCAEANFYDSFFYNIDTSWRPEIAVTVSPSYRAGYDLGYSREDFLSNEYTTAMLTNHAWTTFGLVPALTNLAWGTGWVHQITRTFSWEVLTQETHYASAQTAATYRLTANEARCEMARVGYRLRIPTESGVVSRVRVVEWYAAEEESSAMAMMLLSEGGAAPMVALTTRVAVVMGTGNTQMIERSSFVIEPPTNPGVVFVGILMVDIATDINNDGVIDETDDSTEVSGVGEIVRVNDDLDPAENEDDLQLMRLTLDPMLSGGSVWFTYDPSKVAIWKDKGMAQYIAPGSENSPTWDVEAGATVPTNVFIQGVSATASNASISIVLHIKTGSAECTDAIRFTVTDKVGHYAYFQGIRDYLVENNARLYMDAITVDGGFSLNIPDFKLVAVRAEQASLWMLDARVLDLRNAEEVQDSFPGMDIICNAAFYHMTDEETFGDKTIGSVVGGGAELGISGPVAAFYATAEYRGWLGQHDDSTFAWAQNEEAASVGGLSSGASGLHALIPADYGRSYAEIIAAVDVENAPQATAALSHIGVANNNGENILFLVYVNEPYPIGDVWTDPIRRDTDLLPKLVISGCSSLRGLDGGGSVGIVHRDLDGNMQTWVKAPRHWSRYSPPYEDRVNNYFMLHISGD